MSKRTSTPAIREAHTAEQRTAKGANGANGAAGRRADVGQELCELSHALEGMRVLCDQLRTRSFAEARDERAVPRILSATLTLVVDRMRRLGVDLAAGGKRGR